MGLYLRKSVNLGLLRLNFSKSGLGVSGGVTGFRIGIKPNGTTYVHAGRNGLYYRENLNSIKSKNNSIQYIEENDVTTFETVDINKITSSNTDLITTLQNSYSLFRWDKFMGYTGLVVFSIFVIYGFYIPSILSFIIGSCLVWWLIKYEKFRRTINLQYDISDEENHKYNLKVEAVKLLYDCKSVMSVVSRKSISNQYDIKINAGASSLLDSSNVKIGFNNPLWINTNIETPVIIDGRRKIYFMPDFLLINQGTKITAINYNDLLFINSTINYIVENVPSDTKLLYETWLYCNKDGSRDKRFNNNKQLFECLYGELDIRISNGSILHIITSDSKIPEKIISKMKQSV